LGTPGGRLAVGAGGGHVGSFFGFSGDEKGEDKKEKGNN
jgi:hypothetical protein